MYRTRTNANAIIIGSIIATGVIIFAMCYLIFNGGVTGGEWKDVVVNEVTMEAVDGTDMTVVHTDQGSYYSYFSSIGDDIRRHLKKGCNCKFRIKGSNFSMLSRGFLNKAVFQECDSCVNQKDVKVNIEDNHGVIHIN